MPAGSAGAAGLLLRRPRPHEPKAPVLDEADARRVALVLLRARLERRRLLGADAVLELPGGRLDRVGDGDDLGAVHGDLRRDLLHVARAEQRRARHDEAVARAVLAGDPRAAV